MHDNEVVSRNHEKKLRPEAQGKERPLRQRHGRSPNAAKAGPPHVSIRATREKHVTGVCQGVDAIVYPVRRYDLLAVPASISKVEEPKARKIARAQAKAVVPMHGDIGLAVVAGFQAESLPPNAVSDALLECGEDVRGGNLLVDGAGGVEVPVVVEPELTRCVAATWRSLRRHGRGFEVDGVINPRARREQIGKRGLQFARRYAGWLVIDAEI